MTEPQAISPPDVLRAYQGSDGTLTRRVTQALRGQGPSGELASWLFTAQKASERAKLYGGTKWRGVAYKRKAWALSKLCTFLQEHPDLAVDGEVPLVWGWGRDALNRRVPFVLYLDLPTGQVSFHSTARYSGPDYDGQWDRVPQASPGRVVSFAASLLRQSAIP